MMSRMTMRLQRSPSISSVRLIGQPERCAPSIESTPRQDRLQNRIGFVTPQLLAVRKRFCEAREAMAKLVLAMFMSVDGYIEGPGGVFMPPSWSGDLERHW